MADSRPHRAALVDLLRGLGVIHAEADLDTAILDTAGRSRNWTTEISTFLDLHAGEALSARLLGLFLRGCVRDGLLRPETLLGPTPYTGHPEGKVREEWGPRPVERWQEP